MCSAIRSAEIFTAVMDNISYICFLFGHFEEGVEAGVAAAVERFPVERLFVCPRGDPYGDDCPGSADILMITRKDS